MAATHPITPARPEKGEQKQPPAPTPFKINHGVVACRPQFHEYLGSLALLSLDSEGHIVDEQERIQSAIDRGLLLAASLASGIRGAGHALWAAVTHDLDSVNDGDILSTGHLTFEAGEVIEQIFRINDALSQCKPGGLTWPIEEAMSLSMSLGKLLWLLPCYPWERKRVDIPSERISALRSELSQLTDGVHLISARGYGRLVETALDSGEMEGEAARAVRLSTELACLISEAQNLFNVCDYYEGGDGYRRAE